jgi:hypothetical protein
MLDLIDRAADGLRRGCPAFTRPNLFYAARRLHRGALARDVFDEALDERLRQGGLQGLLPRRVRFVPPPLPKEWDAYFPAAIVLVDRPAILDLFVASGLIARAQLAVVTALGAPEPVIAWLERGFTNGRRAPVVYLHDAATVLYPFLLEPLATLVRHRGTDSIVYRDLGLPPLGATAARFDHDSFQDEPSPILDLEAVPPAVLVRYAAEAALALIPDDPNMLPLTRESERRRLLEGRA